MTDTEKKENKMRPEENKSKNRGKRKTALSYAVEFFVKIAATAAVIAILTIFVVGIYVNHSNSNYPMIKDGDLCITYKLADLAVGDEIAYLRDGNVVFGRIVARAGDVVEIRDDNLTVNGYGVFENAVYPTPAEGAKIVFPYTVPQDTFFVLNDYRSDPGDSRICGGIKKDRIKGKVVMVLRIRGI
ncbi:MAG: signal peptidase I [Lachnospiraceae bacterium]|nr:signal peptidase I [Lachnospiraceae bacterium]